MSISSWTRWQWLVRRGITHCDKHPIYSRNTYSSNWRRMPIRLNNPFPLIWVLNTPEKPQSSTGFTHMWDHGIGVFNMNPRKGLSPPLAAGEPGDRLLQISPEEQEAGHCQELRRHHLGQDWPNPKNQGIPVLESPQGRRGGWLGAHHKIDESEGCGLSTADCQSGSLLLSKKDLSDQWKPCKGCTATSEWLQRSSKILRMSLNRISRSKNLENHKQLLPFERGVERKVTHDSGHIRVP